MVVTGVQIYYTESDNNRLPGEFLDYVTASTSSHYGRTSFACQSGMLLNGPSHEALSGFHVLEYLLESILFCLLLLRSEINQRIMSFE